MDAEPTDANGKGEGIRQLRQHEPEEDEPSGEHAARRCTNRAIGPGWHGPSGPCRAHAPEPILPPVKRSPTRGAKPMQYLPIFLLFMAVLIAAWFYLQRAKARPDTTNAEH